MDAPRMITQTIHRGSLTFHCTFDPKHTAHCAKAIRYRRDCEMAAAMPDRAAALAAMGRGE